MIITQNNIWMRYLMLGLISIFSLSCGKKDFTKRGQFEIVNATLFTITIADPNKNYAILPGSTLTVVQEQPSRETAVPENYDDPITQKIGPRLSLVVKIGDRCITITKDSENSLINIANYQHEKLGDRSYKFVYTFTDRDYNRGVVCK